VVDFFILEVALLLAFFYALEETTSAPARLFAIAATSAAACPEIRRGAGAGVGGSGVCSGTYAPRTPILDRFMERNASSPSSTGSGCLLPKTDSSLSFSKPAFVVIFALFLPLELELEFYQPVVDFLTLAVVDFLIVH
jgi:hypothetical protein